jgi:hypothetical protein
LHELIPRTTHRSVSSRGKTVIRSTEHANRCRARNPGVRRPDCKECGEAAGCLRHYSASGPVYTVAAGTFPRRRAPQLTQYVVVVTTVAGCRYRKGVYTCIPIGSPECGNPPDRLLPFRPRRPALPGKPSLCACPLAWLSVGMLPALCLQKNNIETACRHAAAPPLTAR